MTDLLSICFDATVGITAIWTATRIPSVLAGLRAKDDAKCAAENEAKRIVQEEVYRVEDDALATRAKERASKKAEARAPVNWQIVIQRFEMQEAAQAKQNLAAARAGETASKLPLRATLPAGYQEASIERVESIPKLAATICHSSCCQTWQLLAAKLLSIAALAEEETRIIQEYQQAVFEMGNREQIDSVLGAAHERRRNTKGKQQRNLLRERCNFLDELMAQHLAASNETEERPTKKQSENKWSQMRPDRSRRRSTGQILRIAWTGTHNHIFKPAVVHDVHAVQFSLNLLVV